LEDPDSWWVLGVVLLLVLFNSVFVAAELMVRHTPAKKRLEMSLKRLDIHQYVSAAQLGMTVSSLGLGWVGGSFLFQWMESGLNRFGLSDGTVQIIAFFLVFLLLTLLHAVFGEILPKLFALSKPENVMRFLTPWVLGCYHVFRPVVQILRQLTVFLSRKLGMDAGEQRVQTEKEIRRSLEQSYQHGVIDPTAFALVDNVFALVDRVVREVMVPRVEMVCLYQGQSEQEMFQTIRQSSHTWFPYCGKDKDEILGVIHIKDVFEKMREGDDFSIRDLVRPAMFVPETMELKAVLRRFRQENTGLVVVIDEFGGTSGLVTMEDIMNEMLKEIPRLLPEEKQPLSDSIKMEIDPGWLIDEVNQVFHCHIQDDHNDTIGGWLFSRLEKAPEVGDQVAFSHLLFRVKQVDHLRISKIEVSLYKRHAWAPEAERAGEFRFSEPVPPKWENVMPQFSEH
jgi:CBS domain containing-hemolysin-like protein